MVYDGFYHRTFYRVLLCLAFRSFRLGVMKSLKAKDIRLRKSFFFCESRYQAFKYLSNCLQTSKYTRLFSRIKLQRLGRTCSFVKAKNRCLLTNRSKGIYRFVKLSRHSFKKMATFGLIPGIRKAVW